MVVVLCTGQCLLPANTNLSHKQMSLLPSHTTKLTLKPISLFKSCCSNNENNHHFFDGFSALEADPPWESGSVWSTMGLYFFSLHVPFSFGGLSVVAHLLHQPNLEPHIKAVAILVIETLEMFGALLLLQLTAKPDSKPVNFFKRDNLRSGRHWVFAPLLGFVFLVAAMFFTSSLADRLGGNEDVNNQTLKEILLSGSLAQTACALVYCIIAPFLEESVYRRFLLTSLSPSMEWHQAVIISSVIFAAAHLSVENFIQLFIIGVVLGCTYCWTGDVRSSILLHSMYNALTLFITINS